MSEILSRNALVTLVPGNNGQQVEPRRTAPPQPSVHYPGWRGVFVTGLVLWVASVVVTALTRNPNVLPTVVLLGSFLMPATAVVWYLDHYESPELTPGVVVRAALVGGVLGVLAASSLEAWLLGSGGLVYLGAGFIEELAKLAALVFIARGLPRYTVRDGIVLGAAVGFGFAALESSGYALTAVFVQQGGSVGLSLGSLVLTEVIRGVLAPLGHGLWTAIVGGVLFGASKGGHLRISRGVFGAYLLVSLLHALWDSMQNIAVFLTEVLSATSVHRIGLASGVTPQPSEQQIVTFIAIQLAGLILISLTGIVVLRRVWRREGPAPLDQQLIGARAS